MTARLISSQRYINDEIVAAKQAAKDYTVMVGREIEIDGVTCRIVIDGHHSLKAAMLDGVEPEYTCATEQDCDREGIEDLDEYLGAHVVDSDYYYIDNGREVF